MVNAYTISLHGEFLWQDTNDLPLEILVKVER
jgi:hypothetical protein